MADRDYDLPIVYLIGFMGAGKTTYGKAASNKAGWYFQDLDVLIEQQEEDTISHIFQQQGEQYFRYTERQVLENTIYLPAGPYLIACGGGTPCYGDNMTWMNQHGITVYLKTSIEILMGRLRQMRAHRPMLSHIPDESLRAYIQNLLEVRETFYLQAAYILEGNKLNEKYLAQLLQSLYPGNSPKFGKITEEL